MWLSDSASVLHAEDPMLSSWQHLQEKLGKKSFQSPGGMLPISADSSELHQPMAGLSRKQFTMLLSKTSPTSFKSLYYFANFVCQFRQYSKPWLVLNCQPKVKLSVKGGGCMRFHLTVLHGSFTLNFSLKAYCVCRTGPSMRSIETVA